MWSFFFFAKYNSNNILETAISHISTTISSCLQWMVWSTRRNSRKILSRNIFQLLWCVYFCLLLKMVAMFFSWIFSKNYFLSPLPFKYKTVFLLEMNWSRDHVRHVWWRWYTFISFHLKNHQETSNFRTLGVIAIFRFLQNCKFNGKVTKVDIV